MAFIVGLFLTYLDEEDSFWLLHSLMEKFGMESFYKKDFPELIVSFYKFYRLVKKCIPRLYSHLIQHRNQICPSMFMTQWFLSLFTVNFKFEIVVRIFDIFLCEGVKVLYRFGLAILKTYEREIISSSSLEDIFIIFKRCYENINVNEFFVKCFEFKVSRQDLKVNLLISGL
jgi:TBC1 domain family member 10